MSKVRKKTLKSSGISNQRPPISDPMKRQVRQRCGFGCVLCGLPLYTYEHMLGWANVHRHAADELTLLCSKHQAERTSGLLPIEDVKRANVEPYNLREGISKPYTFHYSGPNCIADIGTNIFSFRNIDSHPEFIAFAIDEDPIISFRGENSHWLLNLNIYDKKDNLTLFIADNELIYSLFPWDIELVGRNLILREAQKEILIDILFEPPNQIKIQRGHFLHRGIEIQIRPEHLYIMNTHTRLSSNKCVGLNGLNLGVQKTKNWGFLMDVDPRGVQSEQFPFSKGSESQQSSHERNTSKNSHDRQRDRRK